MPSPVNIRALNLEERKKVAKQELEKKRFEGLQGPPVLMTSEDWDSIRQQAIDGLTGEPIC